MPLPNPQVNSNIGATFKATPQDLTDSAYWAANERTCPLCQKKVTKRHAANVDHCPSCGHVFDNVDGSALVQGKGAALVE